MKKPIVIVMVALCFASTFGADIEGLYPLSTPSTTPMVDTTTTGAPTTPPTTPVPATTTTTTPAPTTAVPTTTAAPITTTAVPPPAPAKPGNWSWIDPVTNERCVMVQMAIKLSFDYKTKDGQIQNATITVPADAKNVSGTCGASQSLSVYAGAVNFTLDFAREYGYYEISKMTFDISTVGMPNSDGKLVQLVHENTTFKTPFQHSYYCTRPQTIAIPEGGNYVANLTVSHVQLEAFHEHTEFAFSTIRDCDAAETPDIVPIAVGIALAALVIVVLVAYLVARRRSQARGYMSM